jgi:hypothetical protein
MKKPSPAAQKTETRGPLLKKDGTVAVDPLRCPTLYRVLTQMVEREDGQGAWAKVVELRAKGELDAAERAAKRAMGIKGEPMDEETKAKLRVYEAEHKEEIAARRRTRRIERKGQMRIAAAAAGGLVRRKP